MTSYTKTRQKFKKIKFAEILKILQSFHICNKSYGIFESNCQILVKIDLVAHFLHPFLPAVISNHKQKYIFLKTR